MANNRQTEGESTIDKERQRDTENTSSITSGRRRRERASSGARDTEIGKQYIHIYILSLGLSELAPTLEAPHSLSGKPGSISAAQSR